MTDSLSTFRRLMTPVVLVSPLILLIAVPAFFYGRSSLAAASDADDALMGAIRTDETGVTIDEEFVCRGAVIEEGSTTFASLALGAANHKSSISGLGFDEAVVDLKATARRADLSEPEAEAIDLDDDVTVELRRFDGQWCLQSVDIFHTRSSTER